MRPLPVLLVLAVGLTAAKFATGQAASPDSPPRFPTIMQDLRDREYAAIRRNVLEAAEKMPAEHYAFRPVPEVRSFAQEIGHIANVNYILCAQATGSLERSPNAADLEQKGPKDELVKALKESFAFCDAVMADMNDETAREISRTARGTYLKIGSLIALTGHGNEVYGKLVTHLRLKGIVPPSTERAARWQRQPDSARTARGGLVRHPSPPGRYHNGAWDYEHRIWGDGLMHRDGVLRYNGKQVIRPRGTILDTPLGTFMSFDNVGGGQAGYNTGWQVTVFIHDVRRSNAVVPVFLGNGQVNPEVLESEGIMPRDLKRVAVPE